MQVLGTLLPPPDRTAGPTATSGDTPPSRARPSTASSEIVILAVTAQQAEVIKFAQLDGSITLVLRSPDDFIDPTTGEPITADRRPRPPGVILKTLVDTYGVLPPEVVETVTPKRPRSRPRPTRPRSDRPEARRARRTDPVPRPSRSGHGTERIHPG